MTGFKKGDGGTIFRSCAIVTILIASVAYFVAGETKQRPIAMIDVATQKVLPVDGGRLIPVGGEPMETLDTVCAEPENMPVGAVQVQVDLSEEEHPEFVCWQEIPAQPKAMLAEMQ